MPTKEQIEAINSRLTFEQQLGAARAAAYAKMPYFRSLIQSLVPREVPGLGTFGVTKSSILLVDPVVLKGLSAPVAGTIHLHEGMHIYLKHAERFQKLVANGVLDRSDADIWNESADCEINDDLVEAGCEFPSGDMPLGPPITPASLNLPEHRTAEEYVYALKDRRNKGQIPPPSGEGEGGDPGWGQCGSGAGNPLPGEPPSSDPEGRAEADQSAARNSTSEQIKEAAAKGRGNVPSGLRRFAEAETRPSKVRWSAKLSSMVRSAVAHKAGMGDYTFTHRSRLQPAMNAAFGDLAPILPGEHSPICEVAFAIDTSGSMDDKTLRRICDEAQGVLKHMAGSKVTYVACDAKVHVHKRVRNSSEIRKSLKGGGGTDFRPVFEALEETKPRPDVVIFATDGYGPAPESPPKGMKVIWLIVNGSNSCPWGEVIELDTNEDLS